jgi:hypothetical protein
MPFLAGKRFIAHKYWADAGRNRSIPAPFLRRGNDGGFGGPLLLRQASGLRLIDKPSTRGCATATGLEPITAARVQPKLRVQYGPLWVT